MLVGFESSESDDKSTAKLADFGTVRAWKREDERLRTTVKTHASTENVVGTSPYMPAEYRDRGHVSERTDAFAMGEWTVRGSPVDF